jgi:hypothetical protein
MKGRKHNEAVLAPASPPASRFEGFLHLHLSWLVVFSTSLRLLRPAATRAFVRGLSFCSLITWGEAASFEQGLIALRRETDSARSKHSNPDDE